MLKINGTIDNIEDLKVVKWITNNVPLFCTSYNYEVKENVHNSISRGKFMTTQPY